MHPGDRVVVVVANMPDVAGMNGLTGTVVKRKRMLNLRQGWLVELDQPIKGWGPRTTVADVALQHLDR